MGQFVVALNLWDCSYSRSVEVTVLLQGGVEDMRSLSPSFLDLTNGLTPWMVLSSGHFCPSQTTLPKKDPVRACQQEILALLLY